MCGVSRLLFLVTALSSILSRSAASGGKGERCVYHHLLNLNQSSDIICTSRFMQGSRYYHTVGHGTIAERPMDIIHCEASTDTLMHLNLYSDANKDGLKLLVMSSVPCVFINSTNCTCVNLYLNLSHFDQYNDSTIPICGFNRQDHNLECFCIHYILLNTSTEHGTTSTTTQTRPEHVTTGKTEHSKPQSQPAVAPQGSYSAAAFSSAVSVLVVAVVILSALLLLAILYIVWHKKKQSRQSWDFKLGARSCDERSSTTSSVAAPPKNDTPKDISRVVPDEAGSDDEHHHDIGETDALLQSPVVQRSLSCPCPVVSPHEGLGGDTETLM